MIKRKIQVLRPLWEKSSPPQRYLFQDPYHWAIPSLWEQLRESTYFDLSNWYIRALWVDMIEAKCGSKSFAGYQNQFCASYLTTLVLHIGAVPHKWKKLHAGWEWLIRGVQVFVSIWKEVEKWLHRGIGATNEEHFACFAICYCNGMPMIVSNSLTAAVQLA